MSSAVIAKSKKLTRLDALEAKVAALEAKIESLSRSMKNSQTSDTSGALKVQDMNDQTMDSQARAVSGDVSQPTLTEEQRKEIEKTLEGYKQSQKEQQKILDEIMNEDT